MRPRSRGAISPELCQFLVLTLETEGAGKAGCRLTPAVSCAKLHIVGAHEHTGSAETARPSPRNGFTAYIALSPVSGLFATVIPEKRASQELDASIAAPGPHDFAVRLRSVVCACAPETKASIAFRPNAS